MATVILGSGIVGLSTAYFLCEGGNTKPASIQLVDSTEELLHCASGFAGGFLAEDCMLPFLPLSISQATPLSYGF
jgi:glycine/D-amino acid oxidase-like deaminating enzyme